MLIFTLLSVSGKQKHEMTAINPNWIHFSFPFFVIPESLYEKNTQQNVRKLKLLNKYYSNNALYKKKYVFDFFSVYFPL